MDMNLFYDIGSLLHRLTDYMLAYREDDIKVMRLLCKTYTVVINSGWKDATTLFGKKVHIHIPFYTS